MSDTDRTKGSTMSDVFTSTHVIGAIRFRTRNSEYLATWEHGHREARLTCLSGTFAGDTFHVQAEDVRDLAWPGEAPRFTDLQGWVVLTTTTIVSVDRSHS